MPLDTERLQMAIAAIFGGVIYGLYDFVGLVMAGQPPTRADFIKAGVNMASAIMVGLIVAYFAGPAIAAMLPWPQLRHPLTIGLIIGGFGFQLIPIVRDAAKKWVSSKVGGVQ